MFKFKMYESFSDELKSSWQQFENVSSLYVFQTFTWSKHWYETIGAQENYLLNIVEISDKKDDIIMMLPLVKKRNFYFWNIEWIGDIQFDYQAPICNEKFVWTEIIFNKMMTQLEIIFKKNNISYIHFINQPKIINNYYNPFYIYLKSYEIQQASYIDFSLEEDYFKKPSLKKILLDSKRQKKRLKKIGNIKFIIAENEIDFKLQAETMISQKQVQYLNGGIKNLLKKDYIKNFYRFSFHKGINNLQMASLEINEAFISTHWGAVYKNRFYYMMPAYERGEMSKYSTGKILLEELIKWSIDNGIKIFDFTIGGEAYKKGWCNSELSISKTLIPLTLIGRIFSNYIIFEKKLTLKILRLHKIMSFYRFLKKYLKA